MERSVPPRIWWYAPAPETEQGLERGHGLPVPIVAKDDEEVGYYAGVFEPR
jgi:hypothetical protein